MLSTAPTSPGVNAKRPLEFASGRSCSISPSQTFMSPTDRLSGKNDETPPLHETALAACSGARN